MSTDLTTGRNTRITPETTYLTLSDKLGELFKNKNINLCRDFFFDKFSDDNLFVKTLDDPKTRWNLLTRYKNSNNYTSNKFDDVIILNMIADKEEFLDVKTDTIESRKSLIKSSCSSYVENGYCSNFNEELTGFFPHLDRPGEIVSLNSTSGGIVCFEFGFTTIYANITYEDSCGVNYKQPVPSYSDYTYNELTNSIENEKWDYNTLLDDIPEYATFKWEISGNTEELSKDIMIKNDETNKNILEIATLSTAIIDQIKVSLTYTENIIF